VHDAARPLFRGEVLRDWLAQLETMGADAALVPVLPVSDTLLGVAGDLAESRVDRGRLASAQTPQLFGLSLLRRAHEAALDRGELSASDDSGLVLELGVQPRIVPGDPGNFKVTTQADLARAEGLLRAEIADRKGPSRSGIGYDSHRFDRARPLILGGIEVPSEAGGLSGHSDADVLTHAVMDALLGAAGLGDIGARFPDDDPSYAGADSFMLLASVGEWLAASSLVPWQVDCTVIAERPRLAAHIPAMRARLAASLGLPEERVSVKATTNEGMGAIGRGEGMAALAIATLRELR
jgi:2-C-methyl-D-erythritol 4-phosphate cytidylyltransferase/2-C-methyl-D-erythritol 2,4-cyclodiphosphate synthase